MKNRGVAMLLGVLLAFIIIYFKLGVYGSSSGRPTYFIVIAILYFAYTIFNVLNFSSPIGGRNSKLKLISDEDGRYINDIAKKDLLRALVITLKYIFLPDGGYTGPRKTQTFAEKVARVYLVKNERKGNTPS